MTNETGSIVFQCLDIVSRDATNPETYERTYQILLFGVNPDGKSICVDVTGFRPYFYVQVPDNWDEDNCDDFLSFLQKEGKRQILNVYKSRGQEWKIKNVKFDYTVQLEKHKKLFNFDNGKKHSFIRIEVPTMELWRATRDIFLTELCLPKQVEISGEKHTLKVYEANIDPVLRFFHERELDPAGWICLPPHTFEEMEMEGIEAAEKYTCPWSHICPDKSRLSLAPLLIASWDIECMSSHGDFPQAKKTWRKPAFELLEAGITDSAEALEHIAEAISAGNHQRQSKSRISPIYLKQRREWTVEQLDAEIGEEMDMFEYCLSSKSGTLDSRVTEFDEILSNKLKFPPIAGDELIQIGIVLYRNNKPVSKHIFVLNGCDREKVAPPSMSDVPISVYPFANEKDVIKAFHDWLRKNDPDVLIGYNIFGFDEKYVWERAEELKCIDHMVAWSRLSNSKPRLVEKFLSSAAMGDNTMYIINSQGRLKIDLLPYIRRNYNLDSYTLDNVAATFMSGGINGDVTPASDPDTFRVPTKSTKGAVTGRFIVLMDDENDHVLDKAEIVGVEAKAILIRATDGANRMAEHGLKPVKWAQVKDDVTPKELFALHKRSDADRAKIARYCLQDCDLVMEVFMKLEVLNNAIAMANICSVPVSFIFMRGQGVKIESLIFKECRNEDQLIEVLPAPKNGFGRKEEDVIGEEIPEAEEPTYEGAFVLDPVTGIYFDDDPVGVPDFSSLYPSTIISENICHSSVVWVKDTKQDGSVTLVEGSDEYDNLPGIGYIDIEYDVLINDPKDKRKHPEKIVNGTRVVRYAQLPDNEKSTIPKILMKLLDARKSTRKQIGKESDEFRKALLDASQLAYKLTANSLYGQLGSGTSKIRRVILAASTTAYGRKQLIAAKNIIEAIYGGGRDARCDAMAVYGDTDSLFIRWRPKDSATGERLSGLEAVTLAKELTEEAGALVSSVLKEPHDFEFDKVFKTFCLLSKKRYVGDMSEGDMDDFHRKAMGIVMKRRDNAPIVKYVYGGVIENILTKQDIKAAFEFAQRSCRELISGKFPLSKLTITKSLRAEYKTPSPPAHKVLAERIGARDPGNKPSTSERIPFIYIPAPEGSTHQGERIETPTFIRANNLKPDYAFYITNQISKPVAQVFGLVVEKLPGVRKEDVDIANRSKKPTEAREALAEQLLFGKILEEVTRKQKEDKVKRNQSDATAARLKFIQEYTNKN